MKVDKTEGRHNIQAVWLNGRIPNKWKESTFNTKNRDLILCKNGESKPY